MRISTIVAPVNPPAMPAPTARMPPPRAPRFAGSASQSPIEAMPFWIASSPTIELSQTTKSLCSTLATMSSQFSMRFVVSRMTIGTIVAISPTKMPMTAAKTMRIATHRGMPRRCSQLTTGSRPSARKSASAT